MYNFPAIIRQLRDTWSHNNSTFNFTTPSWYPVPPLSRIGVAGEATRCFINRNDSPESIIYHRSRPSSMFYKRWYNHVMAWSILWEDCGAVVFAKGTLYGVNWQENIIRQSVALLGVGVLISHSRNYAPSAARLFVLHTSYRSGMWWASHLPRHTANSDTGNKRISHVVYPPRHRGVCSYKTGWHILIYGVTAGKVITHSLSLNRINVLSFLFRRAPESYYAMFFLSPLVKLCIQNWKLCMISRKTRLKKSTTLNIDSQ